MDTTPYSDGEQEAKSVLGLSPGVAASIGALGAGGLAAMSHGGARRSAINALRTMFSGGATAVERSRGLPPEVRAQAQQVAAQLRAQGIDPAKARIAVVGTGGTGKSTMSRALASELGMRHLPLDDHGRSMTGRRLDKYVARHGIREGVIAEQTHLLNQVSPDMFDALVHIAKPDKDVRSQILRRGRGAWQLDAFDYPRVRKAVEAGFSHTRGDSIPVVPGVNVKVRPAGGFNGNDVLMHKLRSLGVDPAGMSREQMVQSAVLGKAYTGSGGVTPYLRSGPVAGSLLAAAAGGGGAYALTQMPRETTDEG